MTTTSTDLSDSWNALAATVRGAGQDQYNATLGLAKFLSEDALRQKDIELKNVDLQKRELELRESKRKEAWLNQEVPLQQTLQMFSGNQSLAQNPKMLIMADDVMKTFGWKIDDTNPDPNQPILGKNGKPITNRDVAFNGPMIGAYVAANTDVFDRMLRGASALKQQLGATSAGPWLSDQEKTTFAADPEKAEILQQYEQIKSDYDRYSQKPTVIYREQLNKLDTVAAHIKAVGGDTGLIDKRRTELEKVIAQADKQETERQYEITPELSKVTGLPTGTRVDEKLLQAGTTGLMGIKGHQIGAAATVEAARIHAAAQLAGIKEQIAQGKILTAQTNFTNHMLVEIPKLAMEQYDKTHRKDGLGNYLDKNGEIMSSDQVQSEQAAIANKMKTDTYQWAQDTGLLSKLQLTTPPNVFMAPPQTRQEFAAADQALGQVTKGIKDQGFLTQINNTRQKASALLKQADPAQWDQARKMMLDATVSAQQYLEIDKKAREQRQAQLPAKIKRSISNIASQGNAGLIGFGEEYGL